MAGKITSLVVQKRNKDRVNVFIDNEFAFGLAMIEALKLKKGQVLSEEDIERLQALDEIEVARERALNYLSYRPRSADEVRQNLRKKEFSESAINLVITRLEETGLLSDESFTQFWIENREQFAPRSAQALRYELRQKGVEDHIIDETLDSFDESDAAYRAAGKRLRRYLGKDRQTFRKKLGDYLARRGFPYPIIKDVLERLWEESGEEAYASANPDHDNLT